MKNIESNRHLNIRFAKTSSKNFNSVEKPSRITSNGKEFHELESNLTEGRFPVNDHHRNLTVEETRIQAKTVKNSNKYNSKTATTKSLYEERGSTTTRKNACMISDGGKIISKSASNNTFYHVNNNADQRQHQQQTTQQSYIKHQRFNIKYQHSLINIQLSQIKYNKPN
jgi:hypothetical protein